MTKLGRIQTALVVAALAGVYASVSAAQRVPENILALSTVCGGLGMTFGALQALRKRTWGVGLVFAAAVAFGTAAQLRMGPPMFWWIALAGGIPMALGAKPFARFDRGAALLFAGGAAAVGVGAALTWNEVAPTIWQLTH